MNMLRFALIIACAIGPMTASAQQSQFAEACGASSIDKLKDTPRQEDPKMQEKMDRLADNLRSGHQECVARLQRMHDRDEKLGIAVAHRAPVEKAADLTAPQCSVVASNAQPCIQKLSEQLGGAGKADEVVYGNGCPATIELSVFYKDGSRGLATVKGRSAATLMCDDCGGVQSIEAACR